LNFIQLSSRLKKRPRTPSPGVGGVDGCTALEVELRFRAAFFVALLIVIVSSSLNQLHEHTKKHSGNYTLINAAASRNLRDL
jgi:hypothetical protein